MGFYSMGKLRFPCCRSRHGHGPSEGGSAHTAVANNTAELKKNVDSVKKDVEEAKKDIDKAVERAVDSQLNSNMAVEQANCAEETLLPRTRVRRFEIEFS